MTDYVSAWPTARWQFYESGGDMAFEYEHRGWSYWADRHYSVHEKSERGAS